MSVDLLAHARTVETHVRHILQKLGIPADTSVNRRVHAVLVYLEELQRRYAPRFGEGKRRRAEVPGRATGWWTKTHPRKPRKTTVSRSAPRTSAALTQRRPEVLERREVDPRRADELRDGDGLDVGVGARRPRGPW